MKHWQEGKPKGTAGQSDFGKGHRRGKTGNLFVQGCDGAGNTAAGSAAGNPICMTRLRIQREEGGIVCTVLSDACAKWVFDRIAGDTFHWKNVTVMEDGSWRTNCEVFAVRKKTSDYGKVYEDCPIFDTGRYRLRLVEESDGSDLLKVYSDEKAVPLFNSDNCHGDTFHYTSLECMEALTELGFQKSREALKGHDGMQYGSYWILRKTGA